MKTVLIFAVVAETGYIVYLQRRVVLSFLKRITLKPRKWLAGAVMFKGE